MTPFVSQLQRTFWIVTDIEKRRSGDETPSPYPTSMEVCQSASPEDANTISSLIAGSDNLHAPSIDIDWHCEYRIYDDSQTLDIWCKWPSAYRAFSDLEVVALRDQLIKYDFINEVFFNGDFENIRFRISFDLEPRMVIVPSRTRDHFHLYIEKPMEWKDYIHLLELLCQIGIVQKGFHGMSEARRMSHLRKPDPALFQIATTTFAH